MTQCLEFNLGTNSIPIHVLPEQATKEMTEWLFKSSKEANFNMIRVWGGGIYEPDLFYDVSFHSIGASSAGCICHS